MFTCMLSNVRRVALRKAGQGNAKAVRMSTNPVASTAQLQFYVSMHVHVHA